MIHRRRSSTLMLLLAASLALSACGTFTAKDALIVSGETIKATDKQYRTVAAAYTADCKAQKIATDECAKFRNFGLKFNHDFPLAADLWLTAKDAGDQATTDGVGKAIVKLAADLSAFALKLLATGGK